jgi:cysteinyl-tRNA synthetase
VVAQWVREANRRGAGVGDADLREMLGLLGLETLLDVEEGDGEPPAELRELLRRRETARESRDFGQADALREQIRAAGWEVRDGPQGPELVRAR